MRTTVAIDDDVFDQVKALATARDISLGQAVTDLLRDQLSQPAPTHMENGLRVFSRLGAIRPVTPELVRRLESEQGLQKIR
ncbi:MAG TPA: CopG family transcriptional regulator [Acidobacteriaceae bacterium]